MLTSEVIEWYEFVLGKLDELEENNREILEYGENLKEHSSVFINNINKNNISVMGICKNYNRDLEDFTQQFNNSINMYDISTKNGNIFRDISEYKCVAQDKNLNDFQEQIQKVYSDIGNKKVIDIDRYINIFYDFYRLKKYYTEALALLQNTKTKTSYNPEEIFSLHLSGEYGLNQFGVILILINNIYKNICIILGEENKELEIIKIESGSLFVSGIIIISIKTIFELVLKTVVENVYEDILHTDDKNKITINQDNIINKVINIFSNINININDEEKIKKICDDSIKLALSSPEITISKEEIKFKGSMEDYEKFLIISKQQGLLPNSNQSNQEYAIMQDKTKPNESNSNNND